MRIKLLCALASLAISFPVFGQATVDIQGGTQFPTTSGAPTVCHDVIGIGVSEQWCAFASMTSAQYNPLIVNLDSGIIFNRGGIGTGTFFLGPHSASSIGMRMTTTGTTFGGTMAFSGSVAFNGGATASGSTAFNLSGSTATFSTPTGAATFGGPTNSFTNGVITVVSGLTGNTNSPALKVGSSDAASRWIELVDNATASTLNPIVVAGDQVIASNDGSGTGTLVIAPNSGTASGIRISAFGTVAVTGTTTHSGSITIGGGTAILTSYELAQTVVAATMTGSTLSVGGNNCNDSVALTLTGVTGGDVCTVGPPPAGTGTALTATCYASASNTVKLHVCNSSTSANSITASGVFRLRTFGQ